MDNLLLKKERTNHGKGQKRTLAEKRQSAL